MASKANYSQGLLLFRLKNGRQFALGTLKIQELVPYKPVTSMVRSESGVKGVLTIRNQTIAVIDMAEVIGLGPIPESKLKQSFIVVTDCQRRTVGFIVSQIDKIVETNWREIKQPDKKLGAGVFITGTVKIEDEFIQLIDVELLLNKIFPADPRAALAVVTDFQREQLKPMNILVVDDSLTARRQLTDVLELLNVPFHVTDNGQEALLYMREQASNGHPVNLLVSDIEMPGLDGYELTFEVRNSPDLAAAYIILHTSLSSEISVGQAHQVGANEALTKFDAKELVLSMLRGVEFINIQPKD
ncbi:chemotaxis protein [Paraglaciecola arctica]|uniref:Two-component system, chemotaxis family, response regulator CheV n=1 Tax=Paraglaciecola arctica BSs20135 TaxID=493475 RepID=K6XNT5_9ALTE|nr:chemotaxis protein [Paraglaciecola arctica]GAC22284.1 two-component system, chemotaxis family, response regulator CheV [Paraglaciecola arctica BSs20135]